MRRRLLARLALDRERGRGPAAERMIQPGARAPPGFSPPAQPYIGDAISPA
jgi:hypothetical protein